MELGKTIKQLRRDRDMTQEQLAEILSISPQAVSRWECGDGMPDLSLIPSLCNLFDVTADTLLGIDLARREEKIKEIAQKAESYHTRGYWAEARKILEAGLREFPKSDQLRFDLLHVVYNQSLTGAAQKNYREETVALGEQLLETSTNDEIRYGAIQILCYTYPVLGQIEKARTLAEKMPWHFTSRECLRNQIEQGSKKYEAHQRWIETVFDSLLTATYSGNTPLDDGTHPYSAEEMCALRKKAITLVKLIFEDGDYGFYHCRLSDLFRSQAAHFARRKDRENTLVNLRNAANSAVAFLEYAKSEESFKHTSLLLRGLSGGTFSTNSKQNDAARLLDCMQATAYDFVRDTDEFHAIVEILTPIAGQWQI